jgi:hypothetical protein
MVFLPELEDLAEAISRIERYLTRYRKQRFPCSKIFPQ